MKKISLIILLVTFVMVICMATYAQEEKILIANSFRNLVNDYWITWDEGGRNVAKMLGFEYITLSAENSESKQLNDLEGAISRGAKAISVMPVTAGALGSMIDLCESQKVWLVSMYDRPSDIIPADYEYWVAHITVSSVEQGYLAAKSLFEALGGTGKIVAIGGLPGTGSAEDRHDGLKRALEEYPGIELLGYQAGNYTRIGGVKVMEDFVSAFGDKIDGIWCGNDDTATGAIEVLKPLGFAGGKMKVVGIDATKVAVEAILRGDMWATAAADPWDMGGLGIVYAYNATQGKILPKEEQVVYLEVPVVSPSNAEEYYQSKFTGERTADWKKIAEELAEKMLTVSK